MVNLCACMNEINENNSFQNISPRMIVFKSNCLLKIRSKNISQKFRPKDIILNIRSEVSFVPRDEISDISSLFCRGLILSKT